MGKSPPLTLCLAHKLRIRVKAPLSKARCSATPCLTYRHLERRTRHSLHKGPTFLVVNSSRIKPRNRSSPLHCLARRLRTMRRKRVADCSVIASRRNRIPPQTCSLSLRRRHRQTQPSPVRSEALVAGDPLQMPSLSRTHSWLNSRTQVVLVLLPATQLGALSLEGHQQPVVRYSEIPLRIRRILAVICLAARPRHKMRGPTCLAILRQMRRTPAAIFLETHPPTRGVTSSEERPPIPISRSVLHQQTRTHCLATDSSHNRKFQPLLPLHSITHSIRRAMYVPYSTSAILVRCVSHSRNAKLQVFLNISDSWRSCFHEVNAVQRPPGLDEENFRGYRVRRSFVSSHRPSRH